MPLPGAEAPRLPSGHRYAVMAPCARGRNLSCALLTGTAGGGVDSPFGTSRVLGVPDYTVRNLPGDLYERLQAAAEAEFRSINEEILSRLRRSFEAQDANSAALHAGWVHQALASGEPSPLRAGELDDAFERGLARAKARKAKAG
jgi:plasmid stability protein